MAEAIIREGCKAVAAGMNPMDLKRGIDMAVEAVVEDIKSRSKDIKTSEEIAQVGTISANGDRSIGEYLARAMEKVGNEGVITVEDAKGLETELDVVEGMQFDRGYLSPYFVTNPDKMTCEYENPFILLYDQKISNLQPLIPVLEAIVQSGRALLIVAEDIEGGYGTLKVVVHPYGEACESIELPKTKEEFVRTAASLGIEWDVDEVADFDDYKWF